MLCSHPDSSLPPMNLLACRLSLYSAAWPPAATSVAACVAAVTAAVENVNHGLGRARTRSFMCPLRTWRLSCSPTREVRPNHLRRRCRFEFVKEGLINRRGLNANTENVVSVYPVEAGGDPIMLQPSATETTQLTSDGHHSYHTDTGFN